MGTRIGLVGESGNSAERFLIGTAFWLAIWSVAPASVAGDGVHREEVAEQVALVSEDEEDARDRWFLALGTGLVSTSDAPSGLFTFDHPLFGSETGEFDADYAGGEASAYELSIGLRLRGRLGLGLAWSQSSLSDEADIVSRLPHPLRFERFRTAEGNAGGLSRDQRAVHLSVRWSLRDSSRLEVAVFGGPSRIELDYDMVTAVRFRQTYPFDMATYDGVETRRESGSATGYHVGMDVVRYFSRRTGVGAVLRYSSNASIDLDAAVDGGTVSTGVGGVQAVVDLRVRF